MNRAFALVCALGALNARIVTAEPPVTNLVEVLPRVEAFCRAMNIDIPHPLRVSSVTQWRSYRGPWPPPLSGAAQVFIGKRMFAWDVKEGVMESYTDREYFSSVFYEHPEQTPDCLLAADHGASVITTNEAVALAEQFRGRLATIGHSTNVCGAVKIRRPLWDSRELPIYIIGWQWTRTTNDVPYIEIEIDGLRRKPNYFFTLQGSPAEEQLDGKRMPWSEPER